MVIHANFPTSTASSTIQTAWQNNTGTRPAGFHSTIISLILAEVGSTRNRAVDRCGQAEALDQSNGTAGREECIGGHPLWAESALKAVKGWRFEAADKESTTRVELKSKTDQRITFSLFASPRHAGFDVPCIHDAFA
jgi:hypothetical protein